MAHKREIDLKWIEKVKIMFLDIHDELTCAHEEDEEKRKKNYIYPSMETIRNRFRLKDINVSIWLLRDVRRRLEEEGDIEPNNYSKSGGNPKYRKQVSLQTIMDPVVDDPDEVAEWDAVLVHAAMFRESANGNKPIQGKALPPVMRRPVVHHYHGRTSSYHEAHLEMALWEATTT